MALDTLDCTLSTILHHKPGRGNPTGAPFLIARTSSGQAIKGTLRKAVVGERLRLWGSWEPQKGYPDPAFVFLHHEILMDEGVPGLVQYLKTYVDGLGLVKATALVEELGDDALHVLRTEPERAAEVRGITPAIVAAIRRHFEEESTFDPAAFARLLDLFAGHRFPKKLARTLMEDWGSDAPELVRANPYLLLAYPRTGWKSVDAFALDVRGPAYPADGVERQVAAIVEGLEQLAGDGHTYGTRVEVDVKAFALLARRPDDEAWEAARRDGAVVRLDDISPDDRPDDADEAFALPEPTPAKAGMTLDINPEWLLQMAEKEANGIISVGGLVSRIRSAEGDEAFALPKYAEAEREVARHLRRLGVGEDDRIGLAVHYQEGLSDEQRAAVRIIEINRVAILAGPPGTGKSHTLAAVIASLVRDGARSIRVVAPTGKAAKRAAELIDGACPGHGIVCSTIHKALGVGISTAPEGASAGAAKVGRGRDEFGFKHGEDDPLDAGFLVADECSMIDVRLMASLLAALATGTRLVLVGDPNQLPSVGPGSVLRDMIAAGVPTATLATIQRSDGGGRVVRACHAIKDGRVPEPAKRVALPTENWVHLEEDDPARIAETIVELHEGARRSGRYDPLWDMQVVSAQVSRPAGICCNDLNAALGRVLNPDAWRDASPGGDDEHGPPFRVGDKVVRVKNGAVDEMVSLRGSHDDTSEARRIIRTTSDRPPVGSPAWFDLLEAGGMDQDEAMEELECLEDEEEADDDLRVDWRWRDEPYSLRETAVVNGDMGRVEDIAIDEAAGEAFAVVRFRTPGRLCRLPMGEHHLLAAYALTIHKMQGSGVPYVIMPVHHSFYWDARSGTGLWSKELVYTGISRAEKLLVTVGQFSAIRAAVGRPTLHQRRTRLAGLIASASPAGPGKERVNVVDASCPRLKIAGVTS